MCERPSNDVKRLLSCKERRLVFASYWRPTGFPSLPALGQYRHPSSSSPLKTSVTPLVPPGTSSDFEPHKLQFKPLCSASSRPPAQPQQCYDPKQAARSLYTCYSSPKIEFEETLPLYSLFCLLTLSEAHKSHWRHLDQRRTCQGISFHVKGYRSFKLCTTNGLCWSIHAYIFVHLCDLPLKYHWHRCHPSF